MSSIEVPSDMPVAVEQLAPIEERREEEAQQEQEQEQEEGVKEMSGLGHCCFCGLNVLMVLFIISITVIVVLCSYAEDKQDFEESSQVSTGLEQFSLFYYRDFLDNNSHYPADRNHNSTLTGFGPGMRFFMATVVLLMVFVVPTVISLIALCLVA